MNPKTAMRLVSEHARLMDAIKAAKQRIGDHLSKCNGLKGFRNEEDHLGCPTQRAQADQATHLSVWYAKPDDEYGRYSITKDDCETECEHCWAAHQEAQTRRKLRRSLGAVRAAMTRVGRA